MEVIIIDGKTSKLVQKVKFENYDNDDLWMKLLEKHLPDNEKKYAYVPISNQTGKEEIFFPYTEVDTYVRFNFNLQKGKVYHLLHFCGNENGQVTINRYEGGAGGGDFDFGTIIKVLITAYKTLNYIVIEHPMLSMLTTKMVVNLAKVIKNKEKIVEINDVDVYTFYDYLKSKSVWTIEEIEKRFPNNTENMTNILLSLNFEYDENELYLYKNKEKMFVSGEFKDFRENDIFEIIFAYAINNEYLIQEQIDFCVIYDQTLPNLTEKMNFSTFEKLYLNIRKLIELGNKVENE